MENVGLRIDLDNIEIEEIEVFLQEGSRGMPEFAASCSTICNWWCCIPSCGCGAPADQQSPGFEEEPEMDTLLGG
ncbi:MAG TPA: hypothetical protein VIX89_05930 [Bryobacteraceae bacterium]